ncbi:hypothetical protein D3C84_1013150 [compost metagenome]
MALHQKLKTDFCTYPTRSWQDRQGQSSARALCAVSQMHSIATSATAAAPTSIQAGASLSPVWLISQVAMKGAVPPNSALAVLKLKAKPL